MNSIRLVVMGVIGVVIGLFFPCCIRYYTQKEERYYGAQILHVAWYVLCGYLFQESELLLMGCVLGTLAVLLSTIDIKCMLLPTRILLVGSVLAVLLRGYQAYRWQTLAPIAMGIGGGIVGYSVLCLLYYFVLWRYKIEGLGYGDVRYLGMLGLFSSPGLVLLGLFLASLVASIAGGIYYLKNKKSLAFPLGPYLSIGAIISTFWGEQLVRAYLTLWF